MEGQHEAWGEAESGSEQPAQWRVEKRGAGWLLLLALAAAFGAVMAGISTRDFISHLDGQVHAIQCSVMPGGEALIGASGCKEAMLSPWSSFFRQSLWGGLPVSLLGLAVFAFLAGLGIALALRPGRSRRDTAFLLLASLVPVVASAIWGTLAATRLQSFCAVCIGMYAASGLVFVFALLAHLRATPGHGALPWSRWTFWALEGVATVALLAGLYAALAPTERRSLEGCGRLVSPADDKGILIPLPGPGDTDALAVLDPLCPACRAFDDRLRVGELDRRLDLRVLLFPLDATCNWMVKTTLHPGACTLSEAMLCAPDDAAAILAWAFEHQERLLALGESDPKGLAAEVTGRFPTAKGCVGTPKARDRVTSGLRWAVDNALPVLTPQLYVRGTRLCDEDTDLGLEFTLARLLEDPATSAGEGR